MGWGGFKSSLLILVTGLLYMPLLSTGAERKVEPHVNPTLELERELPPNAEIARLESALWTLIAEVQKDFPESVESRVLQGMMYRQLGDYTKTLEIWKAVLKDHPRHVGVLRYLGMIGLDMGAYEEAVAYWRRALAINPGLPGLHQDIGFALLEAGQYHEAIESLLQAMMGSSASSKTLSLLGQCYLQLKRYDQARAMYLRAIQMDPQDASAYYGLMTACMRLERPVEADQYRSRFKTLTQKNTHLMRGGYGSTYDLAQVHKGAAALILQASVVYRNHGQQKKTDALVAWAGQLNPETCIDHLKRQAITYQSQQRYVDALAVMAEVTRLEPDNADNHLATGVLSVKARRFDQARAAYKRTIHLAPQLPEAHRELARLYTMLQVKRAEALVLAQRAVALEGAAEDYYVLSGVHMSHGQIPEALAAVQQALNRDPGNPAYQRAYRVLQTQAEK